ncbi:MAG: homoserine kinase [Longimicrobiales bacterium]
MDKSTAPPTPRVTAFAPATVANLGAGYDIFGLAIEGPGDKVTVSRDDGVGIVSVEVSGDGGRLPTDPERNAAAAAGQAVLDVLAPDVGVRMEVSKGLPLSAGLGGSAASAVAGACAVDALLGGGLDSVALLRAAIVGELKGSGAAHPDNAAPSLVGGFVLVPSGEPLRIVKIPTPEELVVVVVHPHVEVETKAARDLLGDSISLASGVRQWGNAAGLVAGLFRGDWELIGRSLEDAVAEPLRGPLVPGLAAAKEAARASGALGSGLSGSGPSTFALCRGTETAEAVGAAMVAAFRDTGEVDSDLFISPVNEAGATVLEGPGSR